MIHKLIIICACIACVTVSASFAQSLDTLEFRVAIDEVNEALDAHDFETAYRLLLSLTSENSAMVEYTLSMMYLQGLGTTPDPAAGLRYLTAAADRGDARSLHALGVVYINGEHVTEDVPRAFQLWTLAAEQGYHEAHRELGIGYLEGWLGHVDYDRAIHYLTIAAANGEADSQHALGHVYMDGRGVPFDRERAYYWFSKAADQGDVEAAEHVAWGLSVSTSEEERAVGLEYVHRLADMGNSRALTMLSLIYAFGFGAVEQDSDKALEFFAQAADQGNVDPYYYVFGLLYDQFESYDFAETVVETVEHIEQYGLETYLLALASQFNDGGYGGTAVIILRQAVLLGSETARDLLAQAGID